MTAAAVPTLVRSIGRWSLAGLVLNGVIGSGVYGLPSVIAAKLGRDAWLAWVIAALAIAVIAACYAEVASRFSQAGGQYLYARLAFGSYLGLQMGWISYLVRLTSFAANINLFTIYLAEFVPAAGRGLAPPLIATVLLGGLVWLNVRGIRHATAMSNVFMVAKLVPLIAFAAGGLLLVAARGAVEPAPVPVPGTATWFDAVMLLIFAYGGFEAGLVPLGEAKNPERDAPVVLLGSLAVCVALFNAVQLVTLWSLPDAGSHPRPLADAARALVGPGGARFMTLGALLSLFGWGIAAMVNVPRLTFAMAEQGDLPPLFGRIHPRYRTPAVSIVACGLIAWLLVLSGSFLQNLTIAAISRLVTYGLVCATLVVFRRRDGTDPRVPPARFRLPAGLLVAGLGLLVSVALASRIGRREVVIMAVVVALATAHWAGNRRRQQPVGAG